MRFDPDHLTPEVSLNRVRFVSSPELPMPHDLEGRSAFDVLGAHALPPGADAAVTQRYGTALAYLLATLKLGPPAARAARPDWDESYWGHWSAVETVYLGGGLASPAVTGGASDVVSGLGTDIEVRLAPNPGHLPLIGAARALPPTEAQAFVFDFGQSLVKRGVARYDAGALGSLTLLDAVPAARLHGTALANAMVGLVAGSILAADVGTPERVAISLASYVADNHPLERPNGGAFSGLSLTDNLGEWLSGHLSESLGADVEVTLLHDGTAAALALSSAPRTAVIMLGTALGVGFPRKEAKGLVPLAPGFAVR